jgi:hypothetical protein
MGLLSEEVVRQINQQVYRKFPEIKGAQPTQKRAPSGPNVILTYRHELTTEDGQTIERVVRATVAPDGQVVKISTSR